MGVKHYQLIILILTILVAKFQFARSQCDVCQVSNGVACHSETVFSLCINGNATRDDISCPDGWVCTAGNFVCYPKEQALTSCPRSYVVPKDHINRCGVCNQPDKAFSCISERKIAFCFGADEPNYNSIAVCPQGSVCDTRNKMEFCTDAKDIEPSCILPDGLIGVGTTKQQDEPISEDTESTEMISSTEATTSSSEMDPLKKESTESLSTGSIDSTTITTIKLIDIIPITTASLPTIPSTTTTKTTTSTSTAPTTTKPTTTTPTTTTPTTTTPTTTTPTTTTTTTTTTSTTTPTTKTPATPTPTTTTPTTTTPITSTPTTTTSTTTTTPTTTTPTTTTPTTTTPSTTTPTTTTPTTTTPTTTTPTTTTTTTTTPSTTTRTTTTTTTTTPTTTTPTTTTPTTTTSTTTTPTTTTPTTTTTISKSTTRLPRDPTTLCREIGQPGLSFPLDNDTICTQFVMCYRSSNVLRGTLLSCEQGMYFSPVERVCVPEKPENCL